MKNEGLIKLNDKLFKSSAQNQDVKFFKLIVNPNFYLIRTSLRNWLTKNANTYITRKVFKIIR